MFDPGKLRGSVAGFESRMTVEPIGNLHLERIEMYPAGVERASSSHSVPLAPGETVNISHKEWSVTEREFEDIVDDYFEGYSEQGVAEKTDIAMSTDSQSQHATALNLGASLSASYCVGHAQHELRLQRDDQRHAARRRTAATTAWR